MSTSVNFLVIDHDVLDQLRHRFEIVSYMHFVFARRKNGKYDVLKNCHNGQSYLEVSWNDCQNLLKQHEQLIDQTISTNAGQPSA